MKTGKMLVLLVGAMFIFVSTAFSMPQFMSLPFRDFGITVQQGWWYHGFKTTTHYGIDYIKGSFNSDPSTWKTFDVFASYSAGRQSEDMKLAGEIMCGLRR